MSPAGDSQWETKHTSFLMQAIIQITFQRETPFPILVFHFKIALCVLRLAFVFGFLHFRKGKKKMSRAALEAVQIWGRAFPTEGKYSKWEGNMTIVQAILDMQHLCPPSAKASCLRSFRLELSLAQGVTWLYAANKCHGLNLLKCWWGKPYWLVGGVGGGIGWPFVTQYIKNYSEVYLSIHTHV